MNQGLTFFFDWEVELMVWMQSNIAGSKAMLALFSLCTYLGDALLTVFLIGVLYLGYDKKIGERIGLASIFSSTCNGMFKNLFFRRRPYFDNEEIKCLSAVDKSADIYSLKDQGFSFPSGHSMNVAATFGSIYRYFRDRKVLVACLMAIILTGISRFAFGVHYPTDVFFGWLIGFMIMMIVGIMYERLDGRYVYLAIGLASSSGLLFCHTEDYFQSYGILMGFIGALLFEKRYVNFKNTHNILKMILRLLLSGAVFLLIKWLLKLPFGIEFLEDESMLSLLYTSFRYGISAFVSMGIVPMIYRFNILKMDDNL